MKIEGVVTAMLSECPFNHVNGEITLRRLPKAKGNQIILK